MPSQSVWKLSVVKIYLGIGSNIEPNKNIAEGLKSLETLFTELEISPIYLAPPFGFVGNDFHNLVVSAHTNLSIDAVVKVLRQIEFDHGRPDIDKFDFVLRPLQDIAGGERHPISGRTFAELWQVMSLDIKNELKLAVS